MTYTAKQIAKMIQANVDAVNAKKITWEQFGVVNRATWELADRGELAIMGSACDRRVMAVKREMKAFGL